MRWINPKVEAAFLVVFSVYAVGAAYFRVYWAAFGIDVSSATLTEIGLGGINASLTVLLSILALFIGFWCGRFCNFHSSFQRFSLFIFGGLWVLFGAYVFFCLYPWCYWLFGYRFEILILITIAISSATFVFFKTKYHLDKIGNPSDDNGTKKHKKAIGQIKFSKRVETIVIFMVIVSSLDAFEDAKQVKRNLEYDWVTGRSIGLESDGRLKVLGKINGTYFFLDDRDVRYEMKSDTLFNIRSFNIEKDSIESGDSVKIAKDLWPCLRKRAKP